MGSDLSSHRKSPPQDSRHYLSPPSRFGDGSCGIHPPPGTPVNESLQLSQIKRKSLPHFSDFSLYPDRFNPPNKTRHRTLSAGSDLLIPIDDDVSQSVRDIDEEILAVEGSKMMKKSNTHHFAFFDYSMIPDKDPKANSKMSSSSP